jgi:hypothetical protein
MTMLLSPLFSGAAMAFLMLLVFLVLLVSI